MLTSLEDLQGICQLISRTKPDTQANLAEADRYAVDKSIFNPALPLIF